MPQGPSPAVRGATGAGATASAADPAGPIRLMFVGRIDPQVKGLDILVEAFARGAGGARVADGRRR